MLLSSGLILPWLRQKRTHTQRLAIRARRDRPVAIGAIHAHACRLQPLRHFRRRMAEDIVSPAEIAANAGCAADKNGSVVEVLLP